MAGNWAPMDPGTPIGQNRNVREPSGSTLHYKPDNVLFTEIEFNVIDISLPDFSAPIYSTVLLANKNWGTVAVGRLAEGGQLGATIECPLEVYATLVTYIGQSGLVLVDADAAGMGRFQCRAALAQVGGPSLSNGDRVTTSVTIAVTNTSADGTREIPPKFVATAP